MAAKGPGAALSWGKSVWLLAGGVGAPKKDQHKWLVHDEQRWEADRGTDPKHPLPGDPPLLSPRRKLGPSSPGFRDRKRSVLHAGGRAVACIEGF